MQLIRKEGDMPCITIIENGGEGWKRTGDTVRSSQGLQPDSRKKLMKRVGRHKGTKCGRKHKKTRCGRKHKGTEGGRKRKGTECSRKHKETECGRKRNGIKNSLRKGDLHGSVQC